MDNLKKLLLSCYVLLGAGAILIWTHQHSLETYWQQSYHRPPPWHALQTVASWQAGTRVHSALYNALNQFWREVSGQDAKKSAMAAEAALKAKQQSIRAALAAASMITQQQKRTCQSPTTQLQADQIADNQKTSAKKRAVTDTVNVKSNVSPKQQAIIRAGERIFFAGDSMMQGVAPHLAARLRQEYGISGLDLSKQSTGLAYPNSFNWPATIEKTLAENPDIRLLAIFLGPNDPWDMPSGKGGEYLTYASSDWEELYRSRIRDIIASAQSRNIDVIWISPPNMRRKKLSHQLIYLNALYESEVRKAGEVFVSGNEVFHYSDQTYSDYMGDGSLKQKMRADDGIHFTHAGRKALANAVFDLIVFNPDQPTDKENSLATNTTD